MTTTPASTTPRYLRVRIPHDRTIVVGDIHGCYDELAALVAHVGFGGRDVLVCVGDLVDRGPRSRDVLEFFRDTPNAYSAFGNHDRRLAGTVRGTSKPAWSQLHTLASLPRTELGDWASLLESLAAVVETDHAIVTHGRLDPVLPIDQQVPVFTAAVGGAGVVIARGDDGVPLWFRRQSWPKPVCVGHLTYPRVELVPKELFALDTGAAKGGLLTALVLPGFDLVSVPAARDYHQEALAAWKRAQSAGASPVGDRPLATLVETLRKDAPDHAELAEECVPLIGLLREHLVELAASTTRRFGEIPPPGPARGDYYVSLRRDVGEAELYRLIQLAPRRGAPDLLVQAASAFPNVSIQQLVRMTAEAIRRVEG